MPARARLGAEPVRERYARVARPLADAGTPGAWLADLPVMAIDGVPLDVADTADNEDAFGRGVSLGLDAPYPKVKVLGLGECGTHAVIEAHLGEVLVDERELARPLLASIDPGMLVLADRGFYRRAFWDDAAATGAQLLWRVQSSLKLHVVTELADGSYLSVLLTDIERQRIRRHRARGLDTVPHGPTVRVIEYDIANRETDGGSPTRLITTILDPELAAAGELAAVYHQRWEFESSLAEIETRQRGSYRVLRSQSPEMVRQEIWALLLTHYAIRALVSEATDPDRLNPLPMSFIRTLRIVRRHVTGQAAFSLTDSPPASDTPSQKSSNAPIRQTPPHLPTRDQTSQPQQIPTKNAQPHEHQTQRATRNPDHTPTKLTALCIKPETVQSDMRRLRRRSQPSDSGDTAPP